MADAVRRLVVRLTAQGGAQVERELKEVGEAGDRAFQRIVAGAQGASQALSLLGPVLSALSFGALARFTRNAIDAVGGLGELADQVGVSTDALQAFQFAATQTGVSAEEMQRALQALTRRIGDAASGNREAEAAFERLGIAFRDSRGNARATEAALRDLAERIQEIENPVERAAAATALLGDRFGQRLIPFLALGEAGLRNLAAEAIRFGAVADAALVAKADEAADKIAALEAKFSSLARNLLAQVAPALSALADAFNRLLAPTDPAELVNRNDRKLTAIFYRIVELELERQRLLDRARELGVPEETAQARNPRFAVIDRELQELRRQERILQEQNQRAFEEFRRQQERIDAVLNPPERPAPGPLARSSAPERVSVLPAPDPFGVREVQRALDEREKLIKRAALREIGMTEQAIDAYLKYQARLESLAETMRLLDAIGSPLPDAAVLAEAQAALEDYESTMQRLADRTAQWRDVTRDLGFTFTSAFEDAIVRGSRLAEVGRGVLQDITRIAIRRTFTEPVGAFISGSVRSLVGSLFGNAKGNIFVAGDVVPFARGGVVTRPTVFPFARGIGLMGEAGPEAILPLRRTRDGRLGVEATGGTTVHQTINVNVSGGSTDDPMDQQRLAREIGRLARAGVLEAIREQRRAGGMLWQAA